MRMGGEAVLADLGIAKRVDARADLYVLEIVIFEMLAGHLSYHATTAQEVMA